MVCTAGGQSIDFNQTVTNIIEEKDEFLHKKIIVTFGNDNLKLIRDFDTTVKLYDLDDNLITDYSDFCALYLEYLPVLVTTITENTFTYMEHTDKDYLGYIMGTPNIIGNFIVGNLDIGGLKYVGFITEDFLETLEIYDSYSKYYEYVNTPPLIGQFEVGNKYTWRVGQAINYSYSSILTEDGQQLTTEDYYDLRISDEVSVPTVPGEVYSPGFEIDEYFDAVTIKV